MAQINSIPSQKFYFLKILSLQLNLGEVDFLISTRTEILIYFAYFKFYISGKSHSLLIEIV